ncbi:hypothetical protein BLS_002806 [Venturia inaequalis]|uniref:FAD-binding domain-containing protein n=1 Tax=Venturia inaequalis TaxID=5025 RepID=A0A8H3VBS6_VENIN|nr:hypothetical protein BLS_002806 [Venturia inaequalis]KAE9990215.1 hypothetical protein EG327_001687 [Venturia inaequalis]
MEIIIVGAGIGGLSAALSLSLAGHRVIILESAPALAEIGAGVQLAPNATKCFWKWGMGADISANSALPEAFNILRGSDGELLGTVPFAPFQEQYGAPYISIHRAEIHQILHRHALRAGAELRLGSRVIHYDFEGGLVRLATGEQLQADLVIAADGVKSVARKAFFPELGDGLEKTGWAAYRSMVPVEKIKANPKTAHVVKRHTCECWSGDQHCVVSYLVNNGSMLNMAFSHPDDVDASGWTSDQCLAELKRIYSGWNPTLAALLDMAEPFPQNWPVLQVKTLPTWKSKSGRFVLMGDAAHAMAFYLSMGVSSAVEDADVLTACLALMEKSDTTLQQAMCIFENVQKPRAEAVSAASLHAGNTLQLSPGAGQDVCNLALASDGASIGTVEDEQFYKHKQSYGIADKQIRDWCYSYDAEAAVEQEWQKSKQKRGAGPVAPSSMM